MTGGVRDELRVLHRRGIDADFIGAGVKQAPDVFDFAHAAADGERYENLGCDRLDDMQYEIAIVAAGGDVEKRDFVGALLVVTRRDFDRIAGVAQAHEVDALDDASRR